MVESFVHMILIILRCDTHASVYNYSIVVLYSLRCRSSNGDRRQGQGELVLSLTREVKDTPANQLDCECS